MDHWEESPWTPEETCHNLITTAAQDLAVVNTMMEMVNGIEQFGVLEGDEVTCTSDTLMVDIHRLPRECDIQSIVA